MVVRFKQSIVFPIFVLAVLAHVLFVSNFPAQHAQHERPQSVDVSIITDEAETVLAVLAKKRAGQAITDKDWRAVFSSEGYTRLKKRELSMRRSFNDEDFQTFVLSDQLSAQAQTLEQTLERWKRADPQGAARLALAYLPKEAHVNAKIYPVIKPRQNSFVFDLDTDPAIFLYLDPTVSQARFENTLAHELHHIGYGTVCPTKTTRDELARLPKNQETVLTYMRAFGEGFAMLAAAGGPNIHPHAVSGPKERERWDRDVANFDIDIKKVERFFFDVLADRLSDEQIAETVTPFYGEQGPWYTVGWKMAVVIETVFGRRALMAAMCDPRELAATYNRAAVRYNRRSGKRLALWSPALIEAIHKTKKGS